MRGEVGTPFRLRRGEKKLWLIHKKISPGFDWQTYLTHKDDLLLEVERMKKEGKGRSELDLWQEYLLKDDLSSIRKALVGVDGKSIRLRQVSPFLSLLKEGKI